MALDQEAGGHAAHGHRRRVEQGLAGDQLFRLPNVGDDFLWRLFRAGGDTREPERRAHQFEERAARHRIGDRLDLRRELVVEQFLKSGVARLLLQAPPELGATRGLGAGD
jgi:hypothetical protein